MKSLAMPSPARASRQLDLGCGRHKVPGTLGVDRARLPGVDLVVDLDSVPYPFAANTFETVYCFHVLEHLTDWIAALREINRILHPGGVIHVRVPYFASPTSFCDPTHKHFFAYETFDYFTPDGQTSFSTLNYYFPDLRFAVRKRLAFRRLHRTLGVSLAVNRFPRIYESAFCYLAPAHELHVQLTSLKRA